MPRNTARKLREASRALREDNALLRAKHVRTRLRAQRLLLGVKARKKARLK